MSCAATPVHSVLQDDMLTRGVISRRVFAWLLDLVLQAFLLMALWMVIIALGVVTLGLGWSLMVVLPVVPFVYYVISLASPLHATPGQAACGLAVADNETLMPPSVPQALICAIVYVVTAPAMWILVLLALVTKRRRLLHDLLSGLVVVRKRALFDLLTDPAPRWTMQGVRQ